MKKLFILIILTLFHFTSSCQRIFLETFDAKQSIKSWKLSNNGLLEHTNHFSFNGFTFYKKTKDSFLVFTDTTTKLNYKIVLSKTYKATPCEGFGLRFSVFSNDSAEDYLTYSCKLFDKNRKTLFLFSYFENCLCYPLGLGGTGIPFPEKQDTVWQQADSMEIKFIFSPGNPTNKVERKIIIDEIYLDNLYVSVANPEKSDFEIFPNPANSIIHFKFSPFLKPKQIQLYDYTGRLVIANQGTEHLNIENLKAGFYFVTILFENGSQATKKVEIN